jgi:Hemerythrin HHE cation binding domain
VAGPVYNFLAHDHERLDDLLNRTLADTNTIDRIAYAEFRAGLLKHISIEEKILLPAAQRYRGGVPLPIAARIRLDHGALVALMVPPPTRNLVSTIRSILTVHNKCEEEVDGLYEASENAIGKTVEELLAMMQNAADVPILPHNPDPKVLEATRRAVERAGYAME